MTITTLFRRFPVKRRYLKIGLKKALFGNRPEEGVVINLKRALSRNRPEKGFIKKST